MMGGCGAVTRVIIVAGGRELGGSNVVGIGVSIVLFLLAGLGIEMWYASFSDLSDHSF